MRSILRDQHLLGNVAYRACCALVLINLIVRFTFFLFSFFASLSLLLGAWLLPYLRLQCFLRSHFGSGSLRQSRCRGCHRRYRAVRFLSLVICKISRFNLFKQKLSSTSREYYAYNLYINIYVSYSDMSVCICIHFLLLSSMHLDIGHKYTCVFTVNCYETLV